MLFKHFQILDAYIERRNSGSRRALRLLSHSRLVVQRLSCRQLVKVKVLVVGLDKEKVKRNADVTSSTNCPSFFFHQMN